MTEPDGRTGTRRRKGDHDLGRRTSLAIYREEDHSTGINETTQMVCDAFGRAAEDVLDRKYLDRGQKEDGGIE